MRLLHTDRDEGGRTELPLADADTFESLADLTKPRAVQEEVLRGPAFAEAEERAAAFTQAIPVVAPDPQPRG